MLFEAMAYRYLPLNLIAICHMAQCAAYSRLLKSQDRQHGHGNQHHRISEPELPRHTKAATGIVCVPAIRAMELHSRVIAASGYDCHRVSHSCIVNDRVHGRVDVQRYHHKCTATLQSDVHGSSD
jgi:hypothetical protein